MPLNKKIFKQIWSMSALGSFPFPHDSLSNFQWNYFYIGLVSTRLFESSSNLCKSSRKTFAILLNFNLKKNLTTRACVCVCVEEGAG